MFQCSINHNNLLRFQASLTLLCEEGAITRVSLGSDDLADEYFGGPLPDAESQAFRRAAVRFGLGVYLYDKSIAEALKRRFNK